VIAEAIALIAEAIALIAEAIALIAEARLFLLKFCSLLFTVLECITKL
jgi:hypothetical protein